MGFLKQGLVEVVSASLLLGLAVPTLWFRID